MGVLPTDDYKGEPYRLPLESPLSDEVCCSPNTFHLERVESGGTGARIRGPMAALTAPSMAS